jgi:hypothetical protein
MIVRARPQLGWRGGFEQEGFYNLDQSEHIMGPGSHVGFPISTKNKNLVYDHTMNIFAKFDSNLFCGFRKKVFSSETSKSV